MQEVASSEIEETADKRAVVAVEIEMGTSTVVLDSGSNEVPFGD